MSKFHIKLINDLTSWIDNNPDRVNIEKIAYRSGYSKGYLLFLFKKHKGKTLGVYIRSRRLMIAASKLRKTDLSIKYVALQSGFKSQQSFTFSFKLFFGITPASYRKTFRCQGVK